MKNRPIQKKCAEWPFGPRSGQESPTLGAKSLNQSHAFSMSASSLTSTFAGIILAHPRPSRQPSVKVIGGNLRKVKHFRVFSPALLTPALSPRRGEGSYFVGTLPRAAFVTHLPWAGVSLPFQAGNLAARAAKEVA